MWLPNRIFTGFRQQCLQKIAWIESFLNENALIPAEVMEEKLNELCNRSKDLSTTRQRMNSAWARHLTEVQEWGLEKGQQEPSDNLKQLIMKTNEVVDDCLELSEYFYEISTVQVKTLTTAPQHGTQSPKTVDTDE